MTDIIHLHFIFPLLPAPNVDLKLLMNARPGVLHPPTQSSFNPISSWGCVARPHTSVTREEDTISRVCWNTVHSVSFTQPAAKQNVHFVFVRTHTGELYYFYLAAGRVWLASFLDVVSSPCCCCAQQTFH